MFCRVRLSGLEVFSIFCDFCKPVVIHLRLHARLLILPYDILKHCECLCCECCKCFRMLPVMRLEVPISD